MIYRVLFTTLILTGAISAQQQATVPPAHDAAQWGDQDDGTFRNPILPGDYSDPDVIRVGSDYYLITSSFQYSPGMAILKSTDLVNWKFVGHCFSDLTQIGPELNWDRMNRYGHGIYAGAIRYHAGKLWVFTTTLDEGIFMTTAEKPEGPWTPAHKITSRTGTDDPCPFWDDDGQAYLVFSTPGSHWYTRIVRMSPDGRSIDEASEKVVDAWQTSEANKLYKFNGIYYIFHNQCELAPDGRPGERIGVWMRSKNIWGPYEKRPALRGRRVPGFEGEPNQGGLVQTEKGDWWFITQQGSGSISGRASFLLPVQWQDGWPIIGEPDELGIGTLVWSAKKPIPGFPAAAPQASDDFSGPGLAPQWEWNYEPRADHWSLTERPGFLRLHAFPPAKRDSNIGPFTNALLLGSGNTLTQRLMTPAGGVATVKLDLSHMADGQIAGFGLFSREYGTLAIRQTQGQRRLVYESNQNSPTQPETIPAEVEGPVLSQDAVWLRAIIDDKGHATFAYSTDGSRFTPFGGKYSLIWTWYRGERLALFTCNETGDAGFIDFGPFTYTFPGPPPHPAPDASPVLQN